MTENPGAEKSIFHRSERYIGDRVSTTLAEIDPPTIARAVQILTKAPATFVYGAGRSGIIGRAFAMRLVQVGLTAYVIGESVTPIVRRGDAVFILSGRGESYSSIQAANIVRREGAELIVVTGRSTSKLAHASTLLIPLHFPDDSVNRRFAPLGTLFESAGLRLTDALIAEIMRVRGETEETMRSRHAIMV
ncbi:MAG: SIS domain-containing protein [Thermoplasmata archaeon]|nr:SIS domain-containing protein [Thermoplasmata archaeon]